MNQFWQEWLKQGSLRVLHILYKICQVYVYVSSRTTSWHEYTELYRWNIILMKPLNYHRTTFFFGMFSQSFIVKLSQTQWTLFHISSWIRDILILVTAICEYTFFRNTWNKRYQNARSPSFLPYILKRKITRKMFFVVQLLPLPFHH